MQGSAKPGGIVLSYETCCALVKDMIAAQEREPIRVKGIDRPIRTCAVGRE